MLINWKRIFDLWASIVKMVQNEARSPEWLANRLQAIVSDPVRAQAPPSPKQREVGKWIELTGAFEIDEYLRENGLFKELSTESEEVRSWLEHPETYPKEYKDKSVFLLLEREQIRDGHRRIAYLAWVDCRVFVLWIWHERRSGSRGEIPALFKSTG